MKLKKIVGVLAAIGIAAPGVAMATNGMLMEGYGPIATSMGGASMAYDNGAAGMANNPATLGMMPSGTSRLDLAIGGLHPDIDSKVPGANAHSGGDAYYMPAVGWVKKDGKLAYGVGVFAQGGMGTEYAANSWVSQGINKPSRSEVGVGNLIVPVSYDVSPDLNIGGSVDFVWAGMDLQMGMNALQMGGLAAGGNLTMGGPAAASPAFGAFFAGGATSVGYFDFSNDNDFSGKANATGWAGKLGMTYKLNKQMTIGATYHSKTSLGDLEADGASMKMFMGGTDVGTFTGKIKIVDFQFPETYGIGIAYQANDKLMLAADYKRIGWANVMKNMHMTFAASDGSLTMDMKLPQEWKDQDVFMLGVAFKATDALTLRAGVNIADNPIPNDYVNPLFPATIKDHYTLGAGFALSKVSEVNASYVYAPKVAVTSSAGYSIDHAQNNWQLMYSHRF